MFLLTPFAKQIPPYVWLDNQFTNDELNILQSQAKNSTGVAIVGASEGEYNANIRRSKVTWLSFDNNTDWLFQRLGNIVSRINAEHYKFDLTGFGESIQLTHYDQSDNGMYGWHQDYNGGSISRKLSVVLQLSDPSEYEGGNLQLLTHGEPTTVEKRRGLVVVFPSFILHQVTPVTKGTRQSLVVWTSGPPLK